MLLCCVTHPHVVGQSRRCYLRNCVRSVSISVYLCIAHCEGSPSSIIHTFYFVYLLNRFIVVALRIITWWVKVVGVIAQLRLVRLFFCYLFIYFYVSSARCEASKSVYLPLLLSICLSPPFNSL